LAVCETGQVTSAAGAAEAVRAGLAWLTGADLTQLTGAEQAACLRALGRADAQLVAAQSAVLAAFDTARGFELDGAGGPRSWLAWQTRITGAAAAGAVGWMRRLRQHPHVAGALAAGQVSPSWARYICDWADRLPQECRAGGEQILLAAAAGGAGLKDLAGLAEEMHARTAAPDADGPDDGFAARSLRLDSYYRGQGQLAGNLTPECTAALRAVLDALGGKTGPEDTRTQDQRDHDALAEALGRLVAARCLPGRGGQPAMVQLHMSLERLLRLPGADRAVADWAGHGFTAPPGADCDASIVPVVTGRLDPVLLDQLAAALLRPPAAALAPDAAAGLPAGSAFARPGSPAAPQPGTAGASADAADADAPALAAAAPEPGTAAAELILTRATRLLSGPGGLAAWLRTTLAAGPAASVSLPLDIGAATEVIPPHLRRAVVLRDKHCAFAGCARPPAACHVHHIIPRSQGGTTSLANCILLCPFHHLIVIHRWHWTIRLHPDGTTTATSPDQAKTLHSHSPPQVA
jgi:Domain of unknown function (DUF222)/HNH endonuclease